jgi:hypothetical protein
MPARNSEASASGHRRCQRPLGLGVLMVALNETLPDAYELLPPAGHPGPGQGAASRFGRWSPAAPAGTLTRQPRDWPSGWLTAGSRPSSMPSALG